MTTASKYIMDDPREGQRLLDKADPSTWIDKFLNSHFPHAKSILSVGCGPGVFLREIAEAHPGIEVNGVDVSQKRIADAQKRLSGLPNARACLGDALNLPFNANHFDLVFCRFLLEYLPDKPLAVREMKRVCTPGGKLLLQDLDGQLVWHFPEDAELQKTTGARRRASCRYGLRSVRRPQEALQSLRRGRTVRCGRSSSIHIIFTRAPSTKRRSSRSGARS